MKFEELKKRRWVLTVGEICGAESCWVGPNDTHVRLLSFETRVDGKKFAIHYTEFDREGKYLRPACLFEERVDVSDKGVIDWVEEHFTSNGFEALYDTIFNDALKNF